MIRAFCTGSRVYGDPRHDSDLDFVVLVDQFTLSLLQSMAPVDDNVDITGYVGTASASLRFGKLNIIAITDPGLFLAWKEGTDDCIKEAGKRNEEDLYFGKISREEAVAIIKAARRSRGYDSAAPKGEWVKETLDEDIPND